MAVSPLDPTTDQTVCCPTCKAEQAWSDTCRRCSCDLTLLHRAAETARHKRRVCLFYLRTGRRSEALGAARVCHALCPDERSARLLAVCHFHCENWVAALELASLARRNQ